MNELKKNELIKTRKLCNIFRFIDDLNSSSDDGKIESNNCNIYPEDRRGGSERSILTQDWTEKVFNGTCMHLHMPY